MTPILLLLVLSACGNDDGDRQFAGDERTAVPQITSTTVESSRLQPGSPAPKASPYAGEELTQVRGDQSYVDGIYGGKAFVHNLKSQQSVMMPLSSEWKAWEVAIDPSESQVAVLVAPKHNASRWEIQFFDLDGNLVSQVSVLGGPEDPSADSDVVTTGSGGLAWAPNGNAVAIALPTGGLYLVEPDADKARTMSPPARVPIPESIAWSPAGNAIAYAARPSKMFGAGIYVATVAALPIDPVTIVPADPSGNRSAVDAQWYENGDHILALIDNSEFGPQLGSLFRFTLDGAIPELEWGPGSQPDNPGAVAFGVSPDDNVTALVITGRSGDSSVVFDQQGDGADMTIPLDVRFENADVTWTDQGLAVLGKSRLDADLDQEAEEVLILIRPDSAVESNVLYGTPAATPIASPAPPTSPVASPEAHASPGASPVASPEARGSPGASPVASPQAIGTPEGTPQNDDK